MPRRVIEAKKIVTVTLEDLWIGKLAALWWTTKNVLIVRPKFPNDAFTNNCSFPAAELVKNKAITEGWALTDLQANDTNRTKVTQTLNNISVDFVIHYDHGSDYTMWGQQNDQFDPAIDINNVSLLTGKAVTTVSCLTAVGLGPSAISTGARAYLGYDEPWWVYWAWTNEFIEAANAANYALLEGKTFQEAYNIGYATYTQKYNQILNAGDYPAAAAMLYDRDHLRLLGDPNAKAIGRHSIFTELLTQTLQLAKTQP